MYKISFPLVLLVTSFIGCKDNRSFYERKNLRAENYFHDQDHINLCHAIEKDDIDALGAINIKGVDVNLAGRDGMTVLLWAICGSRNNAVEFLFEHGADCNVFLESDFGIPRVHKSGDAIIHVIAKSFGQYMPLALKHQGDPNLVTRYTDQQQWNPLYFSIENLSDPNFSNVFRLIESGARIESLPGQSQILTFTAARSASLCYKLIELGADPFEMSNDSPFYLAHWIVSSRYRIQHLNQVERESHQKLYDFFVSKGEDMNIIEIESINYQKQVNTDACKRYEKSLYPIVKDRLQKIKSKK